MNYLKPEWPAPHQVKAYTTLRQSFGDIKKETLETDKLKTLLNLPEEPIWIKQTHSTIVIEATPANISMTADASYTKSFNRVCVVLTADCLPILICNRQGTYVAAIHAGWRGLAGGIIEATLQTVPHPFSDLIVWLGPAIGPQKFEVGKDVFDAFTRENPASETGFLHYKDEKWLANLYHLAKIRLYEQGIKEIYGGQFCTYTQDDLFFSYRRDQGKTGRMASLIWIEENS